MFLRVLCVITSALTVLTTLSMTSCGADKAISSEASESAVTSTADRLSYRLNQYENYKPEETKKIQAAKIFQAGDYWVLVISDNADEISDEITDMIN